MKKAGTYTLLTLSGLLIFLSSCKNDFDVNGEWRETMVVYGMLSPTDSIQYIKINKAFLGKGNAYDMARIADSSIYAPDVINAVIERRKNGSLLNTYVLNYDVSKEKAEGVFANSPNVLYSTTEKILQDGSTYRLVVTNTNTGKVATAETPIVGKLNMISPNTAANLDWINNYAKPKSAFKVTWNQAEDAKVYQLFIRFHYDDLSKIDHVTRTPRFVDWVFNTKVATTGNLTQEIYGEEFYKFVRAAIRENSDYQRIAVGLQFNFSIGANELYNYVEVNKSSNGIVQEKPIYTNIEGGTGIFSSRAQQFSDTIKLGRITRDLLVTSEYTTNLNFCEPDDKSSPYYCY